MCFFHDNETPFGVSGCDSLLAESGQRDESFHVTTSRAQVGVRKEGYADADCRQEIVVEREEEGHGRGRGFPSC